MFRHQGRSRTLKHNINIAIVLSFVAGIVNVTGFLSFKQLTTNVTGHFALFINDVAEVEFWKGTIYFLYIFSFLFGSFLSSFLIEKFKESKKLNVYVVPTLLESFILVSISLVSNFMEMKYSRFYSFVCYFLPGPTKFIVTKISNAVVRTTHLTGLFTDLGIDLSHLYFSKVPSFKAKIKATIRLRVYIILCFFTGGLVGGFLYTKIGLGLNTLSFGAFILIGSLFYDDFRFRYIKAKRKYYRRI